MYKNDLLRKIRLISKFVTSEARKQKIAMHIYLESKSNQTMKFGQLIIENIT